MTAFLVDEINRLAEARAELWRRTRGVYLSIPAIEELSHLMFDGTFEEVVAVLDAIGPRWTR